MDELDRQIAQAVARHVERQVKPAPQRGVIQSVETTQFSAVVLVGAKRVTATYRGRVPSVGEEVMVSKDGPAWSIISITDPVASVAGGSGALLLPAVSGGRPPVSSFTMWGHSYTHSPVTGAAYKNITMPWFGGVDDSAVAPWRIDRALAAMLGLADEDVRHFGVGGAALLSDEQVAYPDTPNPVLLGQTRHGWAWILQLTSRGSLNREGWAPQQDPLSSPFHGDTHTHSDYQFAPFTMRNTAHVLLYGTNDVGLWGDPLATVDGQSQMMLRAWKEANKTVISRLRAGAIVENDQIYNASTQQYGFTYTGAFSTVASTVCNSGTSITGLTSGTGTIVAHLGADWPGGAVSVRFRGEPGAGGSVSITSPVLGTSIGFGTGSRMPATHGSIPVISQGAPLTSTAYYTVPSWTPSYGTICRRLVVPRTGVAQTISMAIDASAAPVWFDGMDLEQTGMAPPVVIGNIPLPPRWSTAYIFGQGTWAAYPDSANNQPGVVVDGNTPDNTGTTRGSQTAEAGDAWALTYNNALPLVVADYSEHLSSGNTINSVVVADLYSAMNGILNPELYLPEDSLHPNASGCDAAARAFYQALGQATSSNAGFGALGGLAA